MVYHVLNRAAARHRVFRREEDYAAFERVMAEALERTPTRLLGWCLMPNHWHFVAWPREDGELTAFFKWLTLTHAMRWRVAHKSVGYGPLYQGRFKSFPVHGDAEDLQLVLRYVERNARSADLCRRAEDWRWGSLHARLRGGPGQRAMLSEGPARLPEDWPKIVNEVLTEREAARVKASIARSRPLGPDAWTRRTADRLGLSASLRPPGRPKQDAID
jgi:putative transposase